MKLDGVTMETTETTEAAAIAEPSNPPDNSEQSLPPPEEATGDGAPNTVATASGKVTAAKPKPTTMKKQPPMSKTGSTSGSRPGMTSRRPGNDTKPTNGVAPRTAPVNKSTAPSTKPPGGAVAPKKTQAVSSGNASTAKTQVKMADKKPSGPATATSNGTKPVNGTQKKTLVSAQPKTGSVPRPMGSTAPKPGSSSSTKPDASAPVRTTRPATAPPTSRAAVKPSTAAASTKPPSVKTTAFRATTAPPSGRTTAAPPSKAAGAVKKDVSRPPPAPVAKKAPAPAAAKKIEASKSAANIKPSTTSTTIKVNPKLTPKPQQTIKPTTTKKPAIAAARFPAVNRMSQTPPGSPVSRSPPATNTTRSKLLHKPTQAVSPFAASKKEKTSTAKATSAASNKAVIVAGAAGVTAGAGVAAATVVAAGAAAAVPVVQDAQAEPVLPQGVSSEATGAVEESGAVSAQCAALETIEKVTEDNVASATEKSPLRIASPQTEPQPHVSSPPNHESVPTTSQASPVSLPLKPECVSPVIHTQLCPQPKTTLDSENDHPHIIPPHNINEEDDEEEEEKEGSQLVSVSEMSGTTQPTEESRPGSAGQAGASAWRVGGALLSELDSEEVSQQGASEFSAPGVLEGTESMDDLGEGSLKGAMDMEGASAGSPDFERVPEIPVNDYEEDEEDEDDNDRVCDMDVGSERADEPQRHDNDVDDEEDEDVEMASEGVTESGLESYGNADEDDFAEDERLDNLNRVAQPPPPPLLPSAPSAQWDQPNPFSDPWAELVPQQLSHEAEGAEATAESPLTDPCQGDSETPTQESAQTWLELGSATVTYEGPDDPKTFVSQKEQTPEPVMCPPGFPAEQSLSVAAPCASMPSPVRTSPKEHEVIHSDLQALLPPPQSEQRPREEPEGTPADATGSNPSSSSVTEDEASDTEGEAQLEDSLETPASCNVTFDIQPQGARCLSTVEEGDEPVDSDAAENATPPSATSQVSSGFDTTTSASNSNAQSSGESCVKSPGIFSLEELPEEAKEALTHLPSAPPSLSEQPYIQYGKDQGDLEQGIENKIVTPEKVFTHSPEPILEQVPPLDDLQPPYFSAICEKTENFTGFTALLHPQRRDHSTYPRTYCDIVKPVNAALASPKLSCTDLPPRCPKQQSLSPQLRRLEQHQRHLQELQQRREQQSRPMEEAEQERKRREEEEERKKKDEAEEEIKRNKEEQERRLQEQEEVKKQEEIQHRKELELQLHQQQEELKQRQQIMQWQQELQESNKGPPLLLSPSSGLCTIYEALEHEDEEVKCEGEIVTENCSEACREVDSGCGRVTPETQPTHSPPPPPEPQQRQDSPTQNGDYSSTPPESPERPLPLELEWGKKVDIVHQLINQTLLLNGDGCSSLLLLPGGAGGTLSPLESSLWPSLLPPLTPPSATVTSVSSFSPETTGASPQGEWTVVELETHH